MKLYIIKLWDIILLITNIIYSCGETASRYFLQEIKFEKDMIDKSIEKNKRTIKYILLVATINSFIIEKTIFSIKFFMLITLMVYLIGILYPIIDKYLLRKD